MMMQLLETVSVRTLVVLAAGALVFIGSRKSDPRVELAMPAPSETYEAVASHDDPPPPPAPATLDLTFTAGGDTWLALPELDADAMTARGPSRMVEDDGVVAVISPVNVPDASWNGRELVSDGGCRESLHEFAIIRRVTGDPSYISEKPVVRWTEQLVATNGDTVVAAKLSHCNGAFASTGTAMRMANRDDALLNERAWDILNKSEFAANAAREWKAAGEHTSWTHDAVVDTIIATDRNGVTWVSSHVHTDGIGCGEPSANFWGLFRVRADRSLEQVTLREIDAASLDAMIDVGGDTPVMLGTALLPSGPLVMAADGSVTASVAPPYFGCPC